MDGDAGSHVWTVFCSTCHLHVAHNTCPVCLVCCDTLDTVTVLFVQMREGGGGEDMGELKMVFPAVVSPNLW